MYFNVALSLLFCVLFARAHEVQEILNSISEEYLVELVRHAELEVQKLRDMESRAIYLNPYVISAEGRHQLKTCPTYQRNDVQTMLEIMTADIVARYNLDKSDVNLLRLFPLKDHESTRQLIEQCNDVRPIQCNNVSLKYRTIDGSCNNLERPNEGRTFSCMDRLLFPNYGDGVSTPRVCRNCNLPDPRTISLQMHRTANLGSLSNIYTALLSAFGQFLDHDMEFGTQPTTDNNAPIQCCDTSPLNENCLPIEISPNDPDLPGITCMNFVRDARCTVCELGYREQMNTMTTAIDCSQIYDTDVNRSRQLRRLGGSGKLKSRMTPVGEFPPADTNANNQCNPPGQCFKTGDFRSNQNLPLAAWHIVFLRLHNIIADKLKLINPQWNEETLFQKTRKIIISLFQHVIYTEFLPLIIGPELMELSGANADNTIYDPSVPLKLINSFAAAGYRLHSIVPDSIFTITERGVKSEIPLRDSFFNMTFILQNGIEDILRGGTRQQEENYDRLLVQSLTTFMYRRNTTSLGLDLASINIQRGRDHGLPPYVDFVRYFHGFRIRSFEDLVSFGLISSSNAQRLKSVYQCVECIDLFTGLCCERYLQNAVVGPTAAILIAKQFERLKFGDRFFFTHRGNLKQNQKKSIQRMNLSCLLCHSNKLLEITENVFLGRSPIMNCNDCPQLDLSPWKAT